MTEDHGGWCAPENAMCLCGQIFDETHDPALCLRLMPMTDEPPMLLTDYMVTRSQEWS